VDGHAGGFEVEVEGDELDKKNGNDPDRRRERALTNLVADLEQADRDQRQETQQGQQPMRGAQLGAARTGSRSSGPCGSPPPASGTNTSAPSGPPIGHR